ncbi:MAG: RNA polymerase sigma factor [Aestuariibaculum sp.]
MMDFSNNITLKTQIRKGNSGALAYLVNQYHKPLCAYVYGLSNDYELAQDIVQMVFIKIWEDRKKVERIKSIEKYLYRAVYNRLLNHWRDNKKFLIVEAQHLEHLQAYVENETQDSLKQQLEIVEREIQNLPQKCKETFLLSKQEGLTNLEIANFMNVSLRTVETQISKAFKILRKKL